jgi:SAM-dependent methyltransferase
MPQLVPPYRLLADAYDDVIGRDFFEHLQRVFAHLVSRYRIGFSSAADLGCGTGLFARHLSDLWHVPVFGVDLSPAMLRVAASNCHRGGVTLLRQDIRQLRLPMPVDLVTANYDTVNHLLNDRELKRLFERVHRYLRTGGHFVFDFITPCDPLDGVTIHRAQSPDGRKGVTQRIRWNPASQLFSYKIYLRDPDRSADRLELHRERAYRPKDVALWLSDAGFIVRDVLDAATLRRVSVCPRRIIVIAQKRAPDFGRRFPET